MTLDEIKENVFISCPFDLLHGKYLNIIIENRINPEIGLNAGVLDRYSLKKFREIEGIIRENGIKCTVHAPFSDLPLGSLEKNVRKAIITRMKKTLDLASLFNAKSVVIHTGFEEFTHEWLGDGWKKNLMESVFELTNYAKNTSLNINIENVFEINPLLHKKIFETIRGDNIGFCLDIGHIRVFSKTEISEWLTHLKPFIRQLHLHDNMGQKDDHLPIGMGILDFNILFDFLNREKITPIITIENRGAQEVFQSIEALRKILLSFPLAFNKIA